MTQPVEKAAQRWLDHISLRRIITSNRFIPEVDGFRFIAILIVILSHTMLQCAPPLGHSLGAHLFRLAFYDGARGVYLFFTISGFILALPFARHHLQGTKPVALRSYFRRRIIRLEPPYILVMVLRAATMLIGYKTIAPRIIGVHLAASLLYLHGLIFNRSSILNPPAWSLEVEIQFYILAPLLTTVFMIRSPAARRTALIAAILLSSSAATLFLRPHTIPSLTLLNFFQYFAAGFLLCDLYLTKNRLSLPPLVWDLLGGAALVWILFSRGLFDPILLPFVTICLYMAGFHGRFVRGFFSIPAISIIGGMCYSLYLTHNAVLSLVSKAFAHIAIGSWPTVLQGIIIYVVSLAAILAVGTLYFILVERPCMDPNLPQKLADRFLRRSA